MSKYLIHACPQRIWYVDKYLVPSLLEQGIREEDITVFNDVDKLGNLKACMTSFYNLPEEGSTWHLQDDVIICRDFKYYTEKYDNDTIVCAFSSNRYDGIGKFGTVNINDLWFSFPCIYIPNSIARDCGRWVLEEIIGNPVYTSYWRSGENDDWAFRAYLRTYHKGLQGYNLKPNLVDHIDYLIGGTVLNKDNRDCRAQYFKDVDLVDKLAEQLEEHD